MAVRTPASKTNTHTHTHTRASIQKAQNKQLLQIFIQMSKRVLQPSYFTVRIFCVCMRFHVICLYQGVTCGLRVHITETFPVTFWHFSDWSSSSLLYFLQDLKELFKFLWNSLLTHELLPSWSLLIFQHGWTLWNYHYYYYFCYYCINWSFSWLKMCLLIAHKHDWSPGRI